MQIRRPEDTPVVQRQHSFGPTLPLLSRVTWGRSEWFLRCREDLVAIRLGAPPRDFRSARRPWPVLALEPSEIAVARIGREVLALPDEHGSFVRGAMVYLDLHLRHSRTEELIDTLASVAPGDPARDTVRLPQPGMIRLIWEGPYHRMQPSAEDAAEQIRAVAGIAPEAQRGPVPWHELSEADLTAHILKLQEEGRYKEATKILAQRDAREKQGPTEYVHRPSANA